MYISQRKYSIERMPDAYGGTSMLPSLLGFADLSNVQPQRLKSTCTLGSVSLEVYGGSL
jgi:hypothetical protein